MISNQYNSGCICFNNCDKWDDYTIKEKDTLYNISVKFGVPIRMLMACNPLLNPYNLQVGQTIKVPTSKPELLGCTGKNDKVYTIKLKDTLYNIAESLNSSVEDIMMRNPGLDPYNLKPGMKICVPKKPVNDGIMPLDSDGSAETTPMNNVTPSQNTPVIRTPVLDLQETLPPVAIQTGRNEGSPSMQFESSIFDSNIESPQMRQSQGESMQMMESQQQQSEVMPQEHMRQDYEAQQEHLRQGEAAQQQDWMNQPAQSQQQDWMLQATDSPRQNRMQQSSESPRQNWTQMPTHKGCSGKTYTVKKGDTLEKILDNLDYTYASLAFANPNIDLYNLEVGVMLCVPVNDMFRGCNSGTAYIIRRGDSISSLSQRFGVSQGQLMSANPFMKVADFTVPGNKICIPE